MSSFKSAPFDGIGSRPLQIRVTLLVFAFIFLQSIHSSSPLSFASNSAKLEGSLPAMRDDKTAVDSFPEKRARPYSFGLGKRSPLQEKMLEYLAQNGVMVDEPMLVLKPSTDKRAKLQRFNFGLGKRVAEMASLEGNLDENLSTEDEDARIKRKTERYQFGLGKRSWFGLGPKTNRNIDEFKRRYNFGLGK